MSNCANTTLLNKLPKHSKQLLAIASDLGFDKPAGNDIHSYFRRKITKLYTQPSFKKFLDVQTSFLPKSFDVGIERWYYYINSDTKPHLCPTCKGFIEQYKDRFCCHECSTKYRDNTYSKTGPKVDLGSKEVEFRKQLKAKRPGYKMVKFGHPRSTFKHDCGLKFEADNYALYRGGVKCECLHKKVVVQTLTNLKAIHAERNSVWTPVKYTPGSDLVTLQHIDCRHKVELPWNRSFDLRCPTCFPNKFGTRVKTHTEYKDELSFKKPEFKLLGRYVDSKTRIKYKHLDCGAKFETTPSDIRRKLFRCPRCSPTSSGSFYLYKYRGYEFKVRGKEAAAIHWLLNNTSIKPNSIELDSDRTIPSILYTFNRKKCYYYPDMLIRDRNILIEVKSLTTIGLGHEFFYVQPKTLWDRTRAKAKACIVAGYKFQMLVFDGGNTRVKLPRNWYDYTHREIVKWFKANVG
jgi:hypothetical protein